MSCTPTCISMHTNCSSHGRMMRRRGPAQPRLRPPQRRMTGTLMMTTCWRPPLELLRKLLRRGLLSLALAPGKHSLLKAFPAPQSAL